MEKQITLRVRPGETVRFPPLCVACGQPAGERLTLQKRRGQLTRRVDAPLCADCARQLARRSGQEERLLRLSWPAAGGVALLLGLLGLLVLPFDAWWLRLLVGLVFGLVGGAVIRWALVRRAAAAELPERRAIREAARIVDFTWRDMTLALASGALVERLRELNPEYTIDDEPAGAEQPTGQIMATEDNPPPEDTTV
jgi:hypothetical protein